MFFKLFAVCLIAVQATSVAAFIQIEPGVYRITNVASESTVRTYHPYTPLFVSSTLENPGPYELFDIQTAPGTGGYTIKNVGLDRYVSAPDGMPLSANGVKEVFSIDPAGGGDVVIKMTNKDLVWTVLPPVVPRGIVTPQPSIGADTQRYFLTPTELDIVHHASSAKFGAKKPVAEDCGHKWSKWSIYRPDPLASIRLLTETHDYVISSWFVQMGHSKWSLVSCKGGQGPVILFVGTVNSISLDRMDSTQLSAQQI